ncbi:hypothetical protein GQ607_006134 [Colletotrichum asianum]|uniref:Uncharacterized protein n=1 Tax=Colletotrichum asianum TaxID=702518 RepID=A0A8H3ZU74_9PEZI|nr:hypothetical protein GQ607_006134 [Colletotrichum asianum]
MKWDGRGGHTQRNETTQFCEDLASRAVSMRTQAQPYTVTQKLDGWQVTLSLLCFGTVSSKHHKPADSRLLPGSRLYVCGCTIRESLRGRTKGSIGRRDHHEGPTRQSLGAQVDPVVLELKQRCIELKANSLRMKRRQIPGPSMSRPRLPPASGASPSRSPATPILVLTTHRPAAVYSQSGSQFTGCCPHANETRGRREGEGSRRNGHSFLFPLAANHVLPWPPLSAIRKRQRAENLQIKSLNQHEPSGPNSRRTHPHIILHPAKMTPAFPPINIVKCLTQSGRSLSLTLIISDFVSACVLSQE